MSVDNRLVAVTESVRRNMGAGLVSAMTMLIIQFLLGMATNLFVNIPLDHPGARPAEYFSGVAESVTWAILHGPLLLQLHAAFGVLIVISAFGLMAQAIRARVRSMIIVTVIGALAVLLAALNGGSFLNYNEDFSSMIMASFFAIAVVAYTVGLYVMGRSSPA